MDSYVKFNPEIEINSDEWSKMMIKLRDEARKATVKYSINIKNQSNEVFLLSLFNTF